MKSQVIAINTPKGGVGKTTTAVHLAHGLTLLNSDLRVLVIELNSQGHVSPSFGIEPEMIKTTVADLIRHRDLPTESAIYKGDRIDIIPANFELTKVQSEMLGMTNSEHYLKERIQRLTEYSIVIIDTTPSAGPLLNSAFNAAQHVIVPVQPGFYSLFDMNNLLTQVQAIQMYTNPRLEVLGYLMSMVENTKFTQEVWDGLIEAFGEKVFKSAIRKRVDVSIAPAVGKTIFQYAPKCAAASDYLSFCAEVMERMGLSTSSEKTPTRRSSAMEVCHE